MPRWSLCYFWIYAELAEQAEHRHAVRAEAEALRAELEELRLQLDPHFLFNALNGVAEEIPEHPAAALAMLRDLTAYLRHSLDGINQTVVTVEAEVGGLSAYLRVQQARFGDRLRTTLDMSTRRRRTRRIASFLLQPLVENAVKHGKRDNGLDVGIDIRAGGRCPACRDREYRLARRMPQARAGAVPGSASRTCAGGWPCTIPVATASRSRERGPDRTRWWRRWCWRASRAGPDRRRRASGAPGDAPPAGRASRRRDRRRGRERSPRPLEAIERTAPQLVFLDIELGGGGDGFDLLAALEQPPIVVFVTAYAEHAVEAFAVNAVDYLLKPVEPERLAESLARAERQLEPRSGRAVAGVIALRTPKQTVLAAPAEIAALRADGDFTHVFVADQPAVMIWRTLGHFEELLPSPPFLRLGRSLIINRDRLRKIETPSRAGAQITLEGMAEPLVLGRTAAARLREALAGEKG